MTPGLAVTDHTFDLPLDYRDPLGATIEVFAREVVASERGGDDLPWLLFLQGGPGGKSPRPTGRDGWLGHALKTHRVLLLDQRGTGRSTPVTAATVHGMSDAQLASYLRCFRADAIIDDAEAIRARLTGGVKWETLGQSYGGFLTLSYLSAAPQGLRACYVTGGLPGITASADEVYQLTYPRVAAKNAEFYRRYPDDVATLRAIADHLDADDVRLPDGDRLTTQRLRVLGNVFGMSDGFDRVHWLLDDAWHGSHLSDGFLYHAMTETGFVDNAIYALQEFIYGQGPATGWAAERVMARHPQFRADATPLLLTGEMMYPWMFEEIRALRPFAGAAEILAKTDDWQPLYNADRLAANDVPVAAAVYFDDMYVDSGLQLRTAAATGNTRAWVTNEYEHNGIRADGGRILGRLMDMAANRI